MGFDICVWQVSGCLSATEKDPRRAIAAPSKTADLIKFRSLT
jgi:hypothetical protein